MNNTKKILRILVSSFILHIFLSSALIAAATYPGTLYVEDNVYLRYNDNAGGFASYNDNSEIGWKINRSVSVDQDTSSIIEDDEHFLSLVVPAIRWTGMDDIFFPFYHSLIQDQSNLNGYTISTQDSNLLASSLEISQHISIDEFDLDIDITIYDRSEIHVKYSLTPKQALSGVEMFYMLSPDFSPGSLEEGTVDTSAANPYFTITNQDNYVGVYPLGALSEWDLGVWGDGPDTLNQIDVFSSILTSQPKNNALNANGDVDLSLKFSATSLAIGVKMIETVVISLGFDPNDLIQPTEIRSST
ncbi:MAG: hypothetical protein ACW99Q_11125, partial [Candidatus Kariarchaeaceae archaeon]